MVREACVSAIWQAQAAGALGKLEGEAVDLLLEFIRDGYARFITEEELSYPVARAAAGVLARFSALPETYSEQLLKFVEEGLKHPLISYTRPNTSRKTGCSMTS